MDRKMEGPWMAEPVFQEALGHIAETNAEQTFVDHTAEWLPPIERLATVHDIAVVSLEGEIGIPEFHYLSELMTSLRRRGYVKIILSFRHVEHLNYRVFQELMDVARRLREVSGDLRFSEINHYLYHILLFVGADQTIDSYSHVEEAILSFHSTHGRRWH